MQPVTRLTVGGLAGVEHVSLAELLKRPSGQPSKQSPKPIWQSSPSIKPGIALFTPERWNERPIVSATRLRTLEHETRLVQASLALPAFSKMSQNTHRVSSRSAESTLNQDSALQPMVTPENVQVAQAQSTLEEASPQPRLCLFRYPTNEFIGSHVAEASQTIIEAVDSVSPQNNSRAPICANALHNAPTSQQNSVRKLNCCPLPYTYMRSKGTSQFPTYMIIPDAATKTQSVRDSAKNIHPASPGCDGLLSVARKRVFENLPMTTIKIRTPKRCMLICNKASENTSRSRRVTLKGDRPGFRKKTTAKFLKSVDPDLEEDHSYNLLDGGEEVRQGSLSRFRNVKGRSTSSVEEDYMPGEGPKIGQWRSNPDNNTRESLLGSGIYVKDGHRQSSDQKSLHTSSDSSPLGINPSREGPTVEKPVSTRHMERSNKATEDTMSTMYDIGILRQERCHAQVVTTASIEDLASKSQPALCSRLPTTDRESRIRKEEQSDGVVRIGLTGSPANEKESGPWSIESFDLFEWRPPT